MVKTLLDESAQLTENASEKLGLEQTILGWIHSEKLIQKLKAWGFIRTEPIEEAFRAIPRHVFLPEVPIDEVYKNKPITTKEVDGIPVSSSSQPSTMAVMLEQLDLTPGHHVLEIGTGTGYNAALIAHIVGGDGHVTTLDIDDDIVEQARGHLSQAGYERVKVVCGDGGLGYPEGAPYDRIIITVGVWDIAPAWREQLKPDGLLLVPLWINGEERIVAFTRTDNHLTSTSVSQANFVRLRGRCAGPDTITSLTTDGTLLFSSEAYNEEDRHTLQQFFSGPYHDSPTGVHITIDELTYSLGLWIALHEEGYFNVSSEIEAEGSMSVVPFLDGIPGKTHATVGLFNETGVCCLMRPPGQNFVNDPDFDIDQSFDLYLRSFGIADELKQRLIAQTNAWDATGRPSSESLQVEFFPGDVVPEVPANYSVIPKRSGHLVLRWVLDSKQGN